MSKKIIDPTANVTALVKAGLRRQDDLRKLESKYQRRVAQQQIQFAKELRRAESKRVDANLAAIIATAQRAVDTQLATANTLAAQVEATRITLEATLEAKVSTIIANVSQLQNAFYQGIGGKEAKVERRASVGAIVGITVAACAVITIPITVVLLNSPGH